VNGNVSTLLIGMSYAGNFHGAIDEMLVYVRELSSNEVAAVQSGELSAIYGSPALLAAPAMNGTNLSFDLIAQPGFQFVFQISTNLTDWTSVRTITIPPSGITNILEGLTASATQEFYRVFKQ
jgi:hypothetical protein